MTTMTARDPLKGTSLRDIHLASGWSTLRDLAEAQQGNTITRRTRVPFGQGSIELFVLVERGQGVAAVQVTAIPQGVASAE